MKKIKLVLLALPLLLCGCESNKNSSASSVIVEPAYKQEFYAYLEENFDLPDGGTIITVEFRMTEAKTFGYDYIAADVYYTKGTVHKKEYLLCVNEDKTIYQVAEVKR